jgi:hypothetical protein
MLPRKSDGPRGCPCDINAVAKKFQRNFGLGPQRLRLCHWFHGKGERKKVKKMKSLFFFFWADTERIFSALPKFALRNALIIGFSVTFLFKTIPAPADTGVASLESYYRELAQSVCPYYFVGITEERERSGAAKGFGEYANSVCRRFKIDQTEFIERHHSAFHLVSKMALRTYGVSSASSDLVINDSTFSEVELVSRLYLLKQLEDPRGPAAPMVLRDFFTGVRRLFERGTTWDVWDDPLTETLKKAFSETFDGRPEVIEMEACRFALPPKSEPLRFPDPAPVGLSAAAESKNVPLPAEAQNGVEFLTTGSLGDNLDDTDRKRHLALIGSAAMACTIVLAGAVFWRPSLWQSAAPVVPVSQKTPPGSRRARILKFYSGIPARKVPNN